MKKSAGILMYRFRSDRLQVFLVHPGGPFWAKKDAGVWSIPKGEMELEEDGLTAACREFKEETGLEIQGSFLELEPVKQPGGKQVLAWAVEGDCDPGAIESNLFSMEWPPRSGRRAEFPEIDRAAWYSIDEALKKILKGQAGLIRELCAILSVDAKGRLGR